MTLRELFDAFTSSPATLLPVVPTPPIAPRGSIDIRIDNPHGVPAHYAVAGLRRSARPLTHVDVSDRRVGVPTRRTIRLPLTDASISTDQLIMIRAAGRTSKLLLYRESLVEWFKFKGTAPDVRVSIAATGSVRFSVSRPAPRPGEA